MAEEGETVVFECAFHANPVTYEGIQWRRETEGGLEVLKRGTEVAGVTADWEEIGGNSVKSRLVLRNVTEGDIGRFYCAVSNGIGEETLKETYLLISSRFILLLIFYFIIQIYPFSEY